MEHEFDIVVIGGGICGLSAGLASARQGCRTLVLTGAQLGGHLLSIERIEGYPGFPDGIAGYELCPIVQGQAAAAGAEFAMSVVETIDRDADRWRIHAGSGAYSSAALIVAAGTSLKALDVPGERRLRGKGVSHCAGCDAPMLKGGRVVVVGGGDSGCQEALTLAEYDARVTLVTDGFELSAQQAFKDRIAAERRIVVRYRTTVEEVLGADAVDGVRVRHMDSGEMADLDAAGVFVYVGLHTETGFLDGHAHRDRSGFLVTDAALRMTDAGLFAAGTVRSGAAGRAAAAAGEGVRAALEAAAFVATGEWKRGPTNA